MKTNACLDHLEREVNPDKFLKGELVKKLGDCYVEGYEYGLGDLFYWYWEDALKPYGISRAVKILKQTRERL